MHANAAGGDKSEREGPSYELPAAQQNNFERKTVGYSAVVNDNSLASKTENHVGNKGILTESAFQRKGHIGYNAVINYTGDQEIIFGFNTCLDNEGDLIQYPELSDRRSLTNKWSSRKGKIGYYSVIEKTAEKSCCAIMFN
jgi:hypothetical protein